MHPLTDFFTIQPLSNCRLSNHAGHHGLRGLQHRCQPLTLRVGRIMQAQPPARITLASEQHIGKALRLAKGVAAL